jgi:TRAP-type C4-dicarboxylate transport system permease small subunit
MTMPDDRQRLGCRTVAGVLLILLGLVIGVGGFLMIAAGCGYAGVCQFLGIEVLIPFAIGAVPFVGGVLLVVLSVRRRARNKFEASETTDDPFDDDSPDDDRRASENQR